MLLLQVLHQALTFSHQFLFPLAESHLLDLHLLCQPLLEQFLFLLQMSVKLVARQIARKSIPTVRLVVHVARRFNQVVHVRANQQRPQLFKVAVLIILHLRHAPRVLAANNLLAVPAHHLRAANNCKWDGIEHLDILVARVLVVRLHGARVHLNAVMRNRLTNVLLQ